MLSTPTLQISKNNRGNILRLKSSVDRRVHLFTTTSMELKKLKNNDEKNMMNTLKVLLSTHSVNPLEGRVRHDCSDRESACCASCVTMMEINHYIRTIRISISHEIHVALGREREGGEREIERENWSSALTLCKQLTASAGSCDYVIVHLSAGLVCTSQSNALNFLERDGLTDF